MTSESNFLLMSGIVAGGFGLAWWYLSEKDKQQKQAKGEPTFMPIVQDAAAATNVPPNILGGIVTAESSWSNEPNKYSADLGVSCIASKAGAVGLAQVLPSTARSVGVTGDPCEPHNNLLAAGRFLRKLYDKYGDWQIAAIAYNWGPGNVDKWLKGEKSVYSGSVAYADKVMSYASKYLDRGISGTVSLMRLRVA